MNILVVDVGGSHVKIMRNGEGEERKMSSVPTLAPGDGRRRHTDGPRLDLRRGVDWLSGAGGARQAVTTRSISGRMGRFRLRRGFWSSGQAMQRCRDAGIGQLQGGRMLFLGLGTGLGSAMIVDGVLEADGAHAPAVQEAHTFEYYVGETVGKARKEMAQSGRRCCGPPQAALEPDYVVIGGGNVRHLDSLPPGAVTTNACRRCSLVGNRSAGERRPDSAIALKRPVHSGERPVDNLGGCCSRNPARPTVAADIDGHVSGSAPRHPHPGRWKITRVAADSAGNCAMYTRRPVSRVGVVPLSPSSASHTAPGSGRQIKVGHPGITRSSACATRTRPMPRSAALDSAGVPVGRPVAFQQRTGELDELGRAQASGMAEPGGPARRRRRCATSAASTCSKQHPGTVAHGWPSPANRG